MNGQWKDEPCIPWHGSIDKNGYGIARVQGKNKRAHRVSWEKEIGPIPAGFDVGLETMRKVIRGSTWKHVPNDAAEWAAAKEVLKEQGK